jgi:broad specificity phosphatase PhoE
MANVQSEPQQPSPAKEATTVRVLFVRHGKTATTGKILPGRTPGLWLDDVGRDQARSVGIAIAKNFEIDAVYASPLERAGETADAICAQTGKERITHMGLQECDFGDWTGKELAELAKLDAWSHVQKQPSTFGFPNGESFKDLEERIGAAVESIVPNHPGKTIVAVSHADVIKVAVTSALMASIDSIQKFEIGTCSVTAIDYDESGERSKASVAAVNFYSDLGRIARS